MKKQSNLLAVFLMGTKNVSLKDKDFGYCHLCWAFCPHNVGFTWTRAVKFVLACITSCMPVPSLHKNYS